MARRGNALREPAAYRGRPVRAWTNVPGSSLIGKPGFDTRIIRDDSWYKAGGGQPEDILGVPGQEDAGSAYRGRPVPGSATVGRGGLDTQTVPGQAGARKKMADADWLSYNVQTGADGVVARDRADLVSHLTGGRVRSRGDEARLTPDQRVQINDRLGSYHKHVVVRLEERKKNGLARLKRAEEAAATITASEKARQEEVVAEEKKWGSITEQTKRFKFNKGKFDSRHGTEDELGNVSYGPYTDRQLKRAIAEAKRLNLFYRDPVETAPIVEEGGWFKDDKVTKQWVIPQIGPGELKKRPPSERIDGTEKGPGFKGTLERPDGNVSTEISIGVEIDGQEVLIPAIVPTSTDEELKHLLAGGEMTDAIVEKAVEHAKKRMAAGQSPFAGQQDLAEQPGPAPAGTESSFDQLIQETGAGAPVPALPARAPGVGDAGGLATAMRRPTAARNPMDAFAGGPQDTGKSAVTMFQEWVGKTSYGGSGPMYGESPVERALRENNIGADLGERKQIAGRLREQYPQATDEDLVNIILSGMRQK